MSSQLIKIVLSGLIIVGAGAYLLTQTMTSGDTLTYFYNADEVLAAPAEFAGKRIRMGGLVKKDSIFKKKDALDYQFKVTPQPNMLKHPEFADQAITVRYSGVVPDTFKDEANVIVAGTLEGQIFEAQELVAKCPSKYESQEQIAGAY